MRPLFAITIATLLAVACSRKDPAFIAEAQAFIDGYTEQWLDLYYTSAKAEWQSNVEIIEGDTTNAARTNRANEALAVFTGSLENDPRFLERIAPARENLRAGKGVRMEGLSR